MNWQLTEDALGAGQPGYICTRHELRFPLGEACSRCASDPGDDATAEHTSREIDRVLMARANGFRGNAVAFARQARKHLKGTDRDANAAAKLSAEAIKWHRLAFEIEDRVSSRDHDRELIQHEREMSGLRASH